MDEREEWVKVAQALGLTVYFGPEYFECETDLHTLRSTDVQRAPSRRSSISLLRHPPVARAVALGARLSCAIRARVRS